MTIDGFDALFLTLAFLIPGFVMHSAIAVSVPQRAEPSHLSFLRFLTLSCVNYAVWSWLVYLLYQWTFFAGHPVRSAIAWAMVILVGPTALGLLLGYYRSKDVIRRALQRIGLSPIHAIPTAWDYKFSRTSPVWVLVGLKDGSEVRGLFGSKSFASSDPGQRDLFIQQVFRLEGDRWLPIRRSEGILISGDHIKHIEFVSDQGFSDEQRDE